MLAGLVALVRPLQSRRYILRLRVGCSIVLPHPDLAAGGIHFPYNFSPGDYNNYMVGHLCRGKDPAERRGCDPQQGLKPGAHGPGRSGVVKRPCRFLM